MPKHYGMRPTLPRRSFPLTVVFAVASLVVVAALALVLRLAFADLLERRALDEAVRASDLVSQISIEPVLHDVQLQGSVSDGTRRALDDVVARGLEEGVLSRIKIFDADGVIVYSDDPAQIGLQRDEGLVRKALEGQRGGKVLPRGGSADHAGERGLGQLMEAFVPLDPDHDGRVDGVAELYVPYDQVREGVAADLRTVVLLLGGGLAVLWLVLYRLVARASGRLQRALHRNEHLALHDALTGLPNRVLLLDRAERALALNARRGAGTGVLLLDLDRFKEVNDTLGHANGDALLVVVAERLQAGLRASDTLARLGGDEFAVLLPDVTPDGAVEVAERLVGLLDEPVDLDGLQVGIGVSIGVAVSPQDGDEPGVLLQRADVAMYTAKARHGGVARYSAERDHYSPERLALLGELRNAVDREELVLHFQPKADARSGEIRGFEALVRWQHPERGLLPPDVFIPLAEHTGLINVLTPYILDRALVACRGWVQAGRPMAVAVNVSARNLGEAGFAAMVDAALTRTGVDAALLVLEITETSLMADPEAALEVLHALKRRGVTLSIDDYGSGYSSLAYIQQLPVDELKIDRRFVRDLVTSERDQTIVRSTIDLGRNLGLSVVAEGVEDEGAWDALLGLRCDQIQGWFLGRPMQGDAVLSWLAEYHPVEAAVTTPVPA